MAYTLSRGTNGHPNHPQYPRRRTHPRPTHGPQRRARRPGPRRPPVKSLFLLAERLDLRQAEISEKIASPCAPLPAAPPINRASPLPSPIAPCASPRSTPTPPRPSAAETKRCLAQDPQSRPPWCRPLTSSTPIRRPRGRRHPRPHRLRRL